MKYCFFLEENSVNWSRKQHLPCEHAEYNYICTINRRIVVTPSDVHITLHIKGNFCHQKCKITLYLRLLTNREMLDEMRESD